MDRRQLILGACSCLSTSKVVAQMPGGALDPIAGNEPELSHDYQIQGCNLSIGNGQLGQWGGVSQVCSGFNWLDTLIQNERVLLDSVFGVSPSFACFDDGGAPNALATTANLQGGRFGTVLFGRGLLGEEMSDDLTGSAALGILAHEWSHIRQFASELRGSSRSKELHADFGAGWYLGWKAAAGMPVNGWAFWQSLYEKGDYAFNSPGHHGTPRERVAAMQMGYNISVSNTFGQPPGPTLTALFSDAFAWGARRF